jgi:hypothetical protein
VWLLAPGNGTQLGTAMGRNLTCPFGVSPACGTQASWSIFGADAAEVPGTSGHSSQEAAMPHIPEDEEPPGESQAAQSQVSAPLCLWLAWLGAKSSALGRGHSSQLARGLLTVRVGCSRHLGNVCGFHTDKSEFTCSRLCPAYPVCGTT